MIVERPAQARGHVRAGWLDSRHTFSFGHYYDPAWMGFGALRVINEDRVAPGAGFPEHGHANMEILSYVLEGRLSHRDSSGGGGVIAAGEMQWMSAGHGIRHSEFNASDAEPVHFLQIWIQPARSNTRPAYAQRAFAGRERGRWTLLAAPDGAEDSLPIRQDARVWAVRLGQGDTAARALDPARRYWLHVARGGIALGDRTLGAGDALGLVDEAGELALGFHGAEEAEALLFDLPR